MTESITNGTEEREHRDFSPSKSERFFNCHGSYHRIKAVPVRETSPYALEGSIAHKVLESGLIHGDEVVLWAIKHSPYDGHPLTKGYHDFHYSIQDALDYIWDVMSNLNEAYGDAVLSVEAYVNPPVSLAPGEAAGYCDVRIHSAKGRILYVIDYKHGAGVAKAAEGNTQVKQYAAGVLYGDTNAIDPLSVDKVVLTIIQPRAFHPDGDIREYVVSPLELVDYLIELDEVIGKCLEPNAPLTPGVSWCQFCEARSSCPALRQTTVAAILGDAEKQIEDLTKRTIPDPRSLDVNRLAYVLQMKPYIQSWLSDVEAHADELSRAGFNIPGFKRVETDRRRKYSGHREELAHKLAALIGCDIKEVYKEPSLLNITDMEDKVVQAFKSRVGRGKKKKAAEDARIMFAYFTTKESSGSTVLVPLEDRRPAVNRVEQTFGSIGGLITPPNPKEKKP